MWSPGANRKAPPAAPPVLEKVARAPVLVEAPAMMIDPA